MKFDVYMGNIFVSLQIARNKIPGQARDDVMRCLSHHSGRNSFTSFRT